MHIYDLLIKRKPSEEQKRQGNALQLVVFEFVCYMTVCVCACIQYVSVEAVYALMSVQSLGSCSSAPTHHWMNVQLSLSLGSKGGVLEIL